jgi:hypothetical protein
LSVCVCSCCVCVCVCLCVCVCAAVCVCVCSSVCVCVACSSRDVRHNHLQRRLTHSSQQCKPMPRAHTHSRRHSHIVASISKHSRV